ncbi:hypothetical protein [Archangium sp.]|uniref:hypothetical protein n=1 Tax=Archangium sp. TaxID=1872627 RepID=UPI002D2FD6B9|nr:hypothetical protein [Archangium sp.]HYO56084.1 hypothetical protein [Archangium sp.]
MRRALTRSPLHALLSGLLLAACGGIPEAELGPSAETLGTQEAALCSGQYVEALSISGISSYEGEAAGSGGWDVSAFANAARLEYYIDGVLRSFEERSGNSGTWYFSRSGISCGTHNFEVRAYPMVIDSAGNRSTCIDAPVSRTQSFVDNSCMCVINGQTYRNGQVNPASSCEICDTAQSRTSWSFYSSGYADTNGYCKQLTSGARICVNSTMHNNQSCTANSDCYTRCSELL